MQIQPEYQRYLNLRKENMNSSEAGRVLACERLTARVSDNLSARGLKTNLDNLGFVAGAYLSEYLRSGMKEREFDPQNYLANQHEVNPSGLKIDSSGQTLYLGTKEDKFVLDVNRLSDAIYQACSTHVPGMDEMAFMSFRYINPPELQKTVEIDTRMVMTSDLFVFAEIAAKPIWLVASKPEGAALSCDDVLNILGKKSPPIKSPIGAGDIKSNLMDLGYHVHHAGVIYTEAIIKNPLRIASQIIREGREKDPAYQKVLAAAVIGFMAQQDPLVEFCRGFNDAYDQKDFKVTDRLLAGLRDEFMSLMPQKISSTKQEQTPYVVTNNKIAALVFSSLKLNKEIVFANTNL